MFLQVTPASASDGVHPTGDEIRLNKQDGVASMPMTSVRWASVATVAGCALLALVCLVAVLRGRTWAALPGLLATAIGFREVRVLQRHGH
ncbi:hypothetical protein DDP54_06305 [Cellulomonas sp. WB94]|nr:hypothetical protein DDP54_06305 [Cellulomonas sp. WB94]